MIMINTMQELFELMFDGDAADRSLLLERFTPELLELYYNKGYIH
ncbi:hypothetical protein [Paenibacillus naphthalenovorans]|nr:hypothetical protein [Paenibacillus naphthalenovorans]SDI49636.1 hypothetical protein SAMN05421868_10739 [Paenibacillus naphthalenovorans]